VWRNSGIQKMIKKDLIFVWNGTNASIPAGWVRETTLDDLFPKGTANSTDPNDTGGSATHTHDSSAHVHADSHTHTASNVMAVSNTNATGNGSGVQIGPHTHPSSTTSAPTGGGLSSVTSVYSAFSNNPPYHEVIFIKPSADVLGIPDTAIALSDNPAFTNNDGPYLGFYKCDGNNSTPNLVNKYLKGAGTGANAGGTGGTYTNVHTLTHTHTVASHTHTGTLAGVSNQGISDAVELMVVNNHTHSYTSGAKTATITSADPELTTTETVEPAYTKLTPVQNRSGAVTRFGGMIGMWLGTLATIPREWNLLTSMNGKHLKMTDSVSEALTTGGSNTHTHASQDHTHTTGTHQHDNQTITHSGGAGETSGTNVAAQVNSSTHTLSYSTDAASYANAATTADSSNNEPAYRTVAFVKYQPIGAPLFILSAFM
jgi:hypothetical protein